MNATHESVETLSVGLVLDWSNCPKVLLSIAGLAISDSLFRRLSEVEHRSSGGGRFLPSLIASCCGCGADSGDEDGGSKSGSHRRKRRGKHKSVARDSISSMSEDEERVTSRDPRHLAQPALQLCFASAILSTSCVIHTAIGRARWSGNQPATAANASSALVEESLWLASWAGGDETENKLDQLGLCCYWVVHGLLLLAFTILTLRRSLCPHPLHLIHSAGVDSCTSAAEGNMSAGITDSAIILAAGAIVSGALPPRAQSKTEPPLSFLEQNVAAGVAVACMMAAAVLFSILLNMIHFEGRPRAEFVTEKVQAKYQLNLGGELLCGRRQKSGNPVKAILYAGCLVSYSVIIGRAAAASVEMLHLAVWAGFGCVVLLLFGAWLAKVASSGFSKKHSFKKLAEKHNWGYGLVVGATVLALGLAVTGLIPQRGCHFATAHAHARVETGAQRNYTSAGVTLFDLPSELAVLGEQSLETGRGLAVFTQDSVLAVVLALLGVMTTKTFYQIPLRCVRGASTKQKRKGKKKSHGCTDSCSFTTAIQVVEGVTSGSLHAVSVSFAGYTVAMGNILAATLGPAASVSHRGPRLSAVMQPSSEAASTNAAASADEEPSDIYWQNIGSLFVAAWTRAMPQLVWTGLSCLMMLIAHQVHLRVVAWHLRSNLDSDSDSDDGSGPTGIRMKAIERLRNNDCAHGVMEGGLYIVSSLVIAAGCAGRGLSAREVTGGWLCFIAGELMLCAFGAVTAYRERRRRGGPASDSDDEGWCCRWSTRSGKRSKTERAKAKRRREQMLKASRAPGPGETVGQSLNWSLHLLAWVLLLLGPYRSSRTSCESQGFADYPLLPTLTEALTVSVWAVIASAVLLGSQRIVMELVLEDVSDAYRDELERDEQTESVENWGPGLVGGSVSVGVSMVLVSLLPPPACV